MSQKAWERERALREAAVPVDRRKQGSEWYEPGFSAPAGDDLIDMFWESKVPGSFAPEIPYLEMVQALSNKGYNVSTAEALIDEGITLHRSGDKDGLRVLTARLWNALNTAQRDPESSYFTYEHPESWEMVRAAMSDVQTQQPAKPPAGLDQRVLDGWIGQLAGASFGTAIEGYTGEQITAVYGDVDSYITEPETMNDDVVYELVFLDVFERMGRALTSEWLGLEWVRQIPFGWSAEWVALRNLNMGIFPPQSGAFQNPYSDWIGVQMRAMVSGLLAPGWPLEAARLAYIDGVVSHAANGVYGGIAAAVMVSLAFVKTDVRQVLRETTNYLPQRSEYAFVYTSAMRIVREERDPAEAWRRLEKQLQRCNWIHAYPNIAAVIVSLWYGQGDMTESFRLLAKCGMDVDCSGGLAGTVLGVMHGVPAKWADPIGDRLETYLRGKEELSIRELAEKTSMLVRKNW
ncbi:MAG: ADP-ribosylglycohydrolase family protein [Anaerolineales bacterium]|nr:ADP-ribosylglycohydrolase family protein [Anaerolineales bacterium]